VTNSSTTGYGVRIADQDVAVEIAHRRPCLRLRIDGQLHAIVEYPGNGYSDAGDPIGGDPTKRHAGEDRPANTGAFELMIDGVTYRGWRYETGNEVYVRLGAQTFIVSRANAGSATGVVANQQHELRADMPGVVVAVHCEVGQTVANGDPLLTIESMKLQATLSASHPAVVERVHTSIESAFERGALLVSFAQPNVAP
jgi:biotin carboxyl carrier protein